ncbi:MULTISPECIES: Lrp/AsnC family transcriptional regulator [Catellatospora]|uniref:AsnC family transcriptional regulator n=2 Tax=Catellatospora TaxID=53365 RepID=A0A8J3KKT8_9ACTN|nr:MULTISPECIES: Lrp/AsnC ligand binding domain-containing protein [Catellatospora]RKE09890.1 AsnC-like helix-turn-helix protein [Catellatospora citrea]GIF92540.1 AsnC family transcriptional regulator [Catellatospora chokoriensis]GIG02765.1 AsnC family transcriptional regulator [Catellatospora citrea]
MVHAYILIQTSVGKSVDVSAAIGEIQGVTRVDAVTGPYDVIAMVEAHTVDELGKLVLSQIQLIPNITRTLTCPIIHL